VVALIIGVGLWFSQLPVYIETKPIKHDFHFREGFSSKSVKHDTSYDEFKSKLDMVAERDKLVALLHKADADSHDNPSNVKRSQLRVALETAIARMDNAIAIGGRYQDVSAAEEIVGTIM